MSAFEAHWSFLSWSALKCLFRCVGVVRFIQYWPTRIISNKFLWSIWNILRLWKKRIVTQMFDWNENVAKCKCKNTELYTMSLEGSSIVGRRFHCMAKGRKVSIYPGTRKIADSLLISFWVVFTFINLDQSQTPNMFLIENYIIIMLLYIKRLQHVWLKHAPQQLHVNV